MKQRLLIALSIVAVFALSVALVFSRVEISRLRHKAAMHDHRCQAVRLAMRMDARELAEPELQMAAALRFGEAVTYHSLTEIRGCVEHPVDLSRREECLIKGDFACLAGMARAAELAIPRPE